MVSVANFYDPRDVHSLVLYSEASSVRGLLDYKNRGILILLNVSKCSQIERYNIPEDLCLR